VAADPDAARPFPPVPPAIHRRTGNPEVRRELLRAQQPPRGSRPDVRLRRRSPPRRDLLEPAPLFATLASTNRSSRDSSIPLISALDPPSATNNLEKLSHTDASAMPDTGGLVFLPSASRAPRPETTGLVTLTLTRQRRPRAERVPRGVPTARAPEPPPERVSLDATSRSSSRPRRHSAPSLRRAQRATVTPRPSAKSPHELAFENVPPALTRIVKTNRQREPDRTAISNDLPERVNRRAEASRQETPKRPPRTATDLPIPLCSGVGRARMLADASSSRRCERSTTGHPDRGAVCAPRRFTGRARTTDRHSRRRHLKRMILQRVGASRSTAATAPRT
jgi:hypothetical protein